MSAETLDQLESAKKYPACTAKASQDYTRYLHVLKVLVLDAVHVDCDAVWLRVVELEDVNTCRRTAHVRPREKV
jgi:hypothetical protein